MRWYAVLPGAVWMSLAAAVGASELELPRPGTAAAQVPALAVDFECRREAREARCELKGGVTRTFQGVAVQSAVIHVREGKVAVAAVFFAETSFDAVLGRLEAVLGPAEDHSERLRGGMGGTFVNTVRAWRESDTVWMAEQFAGRIARSAVSRVDAETFDGIMRARAAQRVNGARDL